MDKRNEELLDLKQLHLQFLPKPRYLIAQHNILKVISLEIHLTEILGSKVRQMTVTRLIPVSKTTYILTWITIA